MKSSLVISWIGTMFALLVISDYKPEGIPDYFPEPEYEFAKNEWSIEKQELGRALFYDPILSKDNIISCASCHSPYNAFAHTDHDLSHGIDDQIGLRNAPALFNLAWKKNFMWDGAINHLDMQALAPINDHKEMGETTENVINKLNGKKVYRELFHQAFGDSLATGENMLKALSHFQLSLISANAKYDKVMRGEEEFSDKEQRGYKIFKQNCGSCHKEPLFTNEAFANNGLELDTTLNDLGRFRVTHQVSDKYQFKVPSLRNLSFTYPYMHDGRFRKLRQVINHYTEGISDSTHLSVELRKPMHLSSNDKVDLLSFLLTLDDKEFVFNPDHQFPRQILKAQNGF